MLDLAANQKKIRPYKMVMHLLSSAVTAGVNLQTNTSVHSVSPKADSEGYWTLETPRGNIKAKRVVFATNGYTSGLLPEYMDAIIPSRGTCARIVTTEPLPSSNNDGGRRGRQLPFPSAGVVSKNPNTVDSYWGARPDGSYIVGGATTYRNKRELWQRIYDDSSLIEPAIPFFEQWARRNFVGWEDSETKIANVWTGIMGVSFLFCFLAFSTLIAPYECLNAVVVNACMIETVHCRRPPACRPRTRKRGPIHLCWLYRSRNAQCISLR